MRKNAKLAAWIPVTVILVLLSIIAFLAIKQGFVLRSVQIISDGSMSDEEIIRAAKLDVHGSIFNVDAEKVRRNIENSGLLVFDSIQVVMPQTVILTVHRRAPEAMLVSGGKIAVMDRNGYIIDILAGMPQVTYTYITGVEVNSCLKGSVIGLPQVKLAAMKELVANIHDIGLDTIMLEVDLSNTNDIRIRTLFGYDVALGAASDVEMKLRLAYAVMDKMRSQGKLRGLLDVSNGKQADFKPY